MCDNYIINKRGLQWEIATWNWMKVYIIIGALSVGVWDQVTGNIQNQGLFWLHKKANFQLRISLLTLLWRRPLSYRNQSIDLLCKSQDWFLYDRNLLLERVKGLFPDLKSFLQIFKFADVVTFTKEILNGKLHFLLRISTCKLFFLCDI